MANSKRDIKPTTPHLLGNKVSGNELKPSSNGSTVPTIDRCQNSQSNIKVVVRIRPTNQNEIEKNSRQIIKVIDDKMLIFDPKEEHNPFMYRGVEQKRRDLLKKQNKELQFIFNQVFDETYQNKDVFENSTKELINYLLDGYNCSVFAYGATGAGKTHTMIGTQNDPGVTYLTMVELFREIEAQNIHREFYIGVTYLEVYNEVVQNLLRKSSPLQIRDDGHSGMVIAGLEIVPIENTEQLFHLLAMGNKNRTQHPTDANQESSRSHAVFQVYINIINRTDRQKKQVKLSMIDLAGSERASATGCKGARFKEGANINKSLLALGNCINNLADGIKHIPYRDSKLTRLLKDSLGGNCHTVMVANISPTHMNYEDTYNTLRYADRAKKIKTNLKKNIVSCEMHVSGYVKIIQELKKERDMLKEKLLGYEKGTIQPITDVKPNKEKEIQETNKDLLKITNAWLDLFRKKKTLNEKMLALESSDRILCCRIQHKKATYQRLYNLTTNVDDKISEEGNSNGESRVSKSLEYFKRQRQSLQEQMKKTWKELCSVEKEIRELETQARSKNFYEKLLDTINSNTNEMDKYRMQQQYEHAKKMNSLQQCETQSLGMIIKMMSEMVQNYYSLVKGYGMVTDKMKQEFKQLIKSLEGVRNIKWSDTEGLIEDEGFYNLMSLSISSLEKPLENEIPIFHTFDVDNENQMAQDKPEIKVLNRTFNATVDISESLNHNATMTLENDSKVSDNVKVAKKRTSLEQIPQSHSTPKKRVRKLLKIQPNVSHNKENKNKGKVGLITTSHRSVMSAKSIAILNRLKSPKSKLRTQTNTILKGVQDRQPKL